VSARTSVDAADPKSDTAQALTHQILSMSVMQHATMKHCAEAVNAGPERLTRMAPRFIRTALMALTCWNIIITPIMR
jgi:hypothetical protein